MAFDVTLHL